MSDTEENFCFFGRPLEPYDEDMVPKKKPISIEDQFVTDAQGRRRFHGAFTGGFSAGFFNTVGSLEGWLPGEFKSTRQEKAENVAQKPEDFMDDEDLGEFGIAPQAVRATNDFSTSKKRKKQVFSDGPIPGEPVLHSLLTSGNESIGYLLLRNIGVKREVDATEGNQTEDKVYGCEMPKTFEISRFDEGNPYKDSDFYNNFILNPKINTFGLGYVGLAKNSANLQQHSKLIIKGRNQKNVSISGQAFGVGAFEDDDEDIYVKDDMSKYDFELTSEKALKKSKSKKSDTVFDDFIMAKLSLQPKDIFLPPTIPHTFTGKHKVKKSRFEPLAEAPTPERKDMNSDVRASYLGEKIKSSSELSLSTTTASSTAECGTIEKVEQTVPVQNIKQEEPRDTLELTSTSSLNLLFDRFVSASKMESQSTIIEEPVVSESTHGSQEMRDAARMKMFGPLTRISSDWQPCSLLCKKFNVPERQVNELNPGQNRKRTKNLIFEYEKFADVDLINSRAGLAFNEKNPQQTDLQNIENTATDLALGMSFAKNLSSILESPSTEKNQSEEQAEETLKDITEKIDIDKNTDLFKAVFLSSSESEADEENEKQEYDKNTEIKSSVLSESLLPTKPLKDGILSNLDLSIFDRPMRNSGVQEKEENEASHSSALNQQNDNWYGPALPAKANLGIPSSTSKTSTKYDDDSDEWVEKLDDDKKNKSYKKKHKHKKSSSEKKRKRKDR